MPELRTWQAEAVNAVEAALGRGDRPCVQAIMGGGKSVVAAELARRAFAAGLHVVITVPTQELVRQLAESIEWWTGLCVGQWYADKHDLWPVTVVCQMSIHTYEAAWREKYAELMSGARVDRGDGWTEAAAGLPRRVWIADEAHRTECETVLTWDAPAKRVGFSATPWRSEFTGSISSFDEVVYEYGADRAVADGHVVKPRLVHPGRGDIDDVVAAWITEQLAVGGGVVNATSIADCDAFASRIGAVPVHSESKYDAVDARGIIREGGVVCYVDMLAEGFDCPEIRFMVLRRAVASRVRFAQEIGRGLRASEGKEDCPLLDIHDLWNTHTINWQACLGEIDSAVVPALKLDWAIEKSSGWGTDSKANQPVMPAELLSPLRSWVRHARVEALFEGRIGVKEISSRSWRSNPCSRKQLRYLDEVMGSIDPKGLAPELVTRIRVARAAIVDCLGRDPDELDSAFRQGDASDLIDVVKGLR